MKLCFYGAGQKERISILCILNLFKNYIYIYKNILYNTVDVHSRSS